MVNQLLAGANAMACFVSGLFFWKFWRRERDRLFAIFAAAFWVLGVNRILMAVVDPAHEYRTWPYVVRLGAFLLILAAIIDKNRSRNSPESHRRPYDGSAMTRPRVHAILLATIAPSVVLACHACATPTPAGHYATVSGYGMYYEEYGHGHPLVLLHGGLNTIAGSFSRQIPVFARTYRVIAIEQVGHGHTPDAREAFTYTQMADDTAALLRQLNVGPADLVGWSDGGIIALVIARRYPDLVRRLVVSGVNVDVDGQQPETVQSLRDAASSGGVTVTDKVHQLWLTPVVLTRSDLAQIEARVLVVAGDHDVIRLEHTIEIFESLPSAELCILPATGHDTFQSAADVLNPLILRFLGDA
ncbi:MAG TPA: DUF5985 family protein [Candidatus Binatia bacterium]|jgi:pimeloyl-ACP methyl ester carboxylesterase